MLAEAPVAFVVYDVLDLDDRTLLDTPLAERQAALDALALPPADTPAADARVFHSVVTPVEAAADLDAAFDAARARGNEGLMIKKADSLYLPGRRGRDWLKLKKALATLDVVVVSVEVGNGARRHLLSDFTFAVRASPTDDALLTVGKAYSGLTDAELAELTVWFKEHTLQEFAHGKVRVVEPSVVVEVAFDRVQPSPRHKSGYALRFPRIVRLRPDKPVAEIDTLAAVAALAETP
jgi:DNA ligase-1